jgi:hypothetical protein
LHRFGLLSSKGVALCGYRSYDVSAGAQAEQLFASGTCGPGDFDIDALIRDRRVRFPQSRDSCG